MITTVRFASVTDADTDEAMGFCVDALRLKVLRETPLPFGNTFMLQEGGL